ncbi:MAG: hypothetical protein N2C14_20430, partial [Planctomycetales bacterium]
MLASYSIGDEPIPGYRLLKFLGRGGFGTVWLSTAPGGMEVALKIIALSGQQGRKEFRALRLVKNIRHANLVPIFALWLKDQYGNLMDDWLTEDTNYRMTQAIAALPEADSRRPMELVLAMGLGDKTLGDRMKECQAAGHSGIPAKELIRHMESSSRAIEFMNEPRHEMCEKKADSIQHGDIKPQNIMMVSG